MAAPSASDPIAEATTFLQPGQHRMVCPLCSHERRKNKDKCLSVVVDPDGSGAYTCWHCGAEGGWDAPPTNPLDDPSSEWFLPPLPEIPKGSPMSREADVAGKKFMRERGIADSVVEKHVLFDVRRFHGEPMPAVGFPYRSQDPLAIKWRCVPRKTFVQENTCADFFNIDAYGEGDSILICEGELDALAWMTAGVQGMGVCPVSVPNGAPSQVSEGVIDPREDKKFACVWAAREHLDECDRIYLNCDPDGPGKALEAELIRRLDASKIWLVRMPEGYKDANDLLRGLGPDALRQALRRARPLPMEGVYTAMDYEDALDELYEKGRPKGAYVGLHAVDRLFQVCPGMLTTVTGFPSAGKSDFIDQVCLLLAQNHGWKTMMVSFEKDPASHVVQLTEKYVGLPYWQAKQGDHGHVRMTQEQADDARHFIDDHFAFVDEATCPTDLDGILRLASMAVMRLGIRVLVIDPYNFIDIPARHDTETNWVSKMLTQVKRWAARHQAHVFFVAHPAKPRDHVKTTSYVCTGLDISGCYSADTEVLTKRGWLLHPELRDDDDVLCFDPDTSKLSWFKPSKRWEYDHDGPMHHYTGRDLDMLVTPNHRMVVSPGWQWPAAQEGEARGRWTRWTQGAWQFTKSEDLPSARFRIPMSGDPDEGALSPVPGLLDHGYPALPFWWFVGFWLAEGHVASHALQVCQADENSARPKAVMKDMLLDAHERIHPSRVEGERDMWTSRIYKRSHPELTEWVVSRCGEGCDQKALPHEVYEASVEEKLALIEGFFFGDGSTHGGTRRLHTTSRALADGLMRLAVECGLWAHLSERCPAEPHHKPCYVVHLRDQRDRTIDTRSRSEVPYTGKVYCLTVPTGAYVTRRQGKVALQGNSANWFNKTDIGLTVRRDENDQNYLHTWKIRWSWIGQNNAVSAIDFDPSCSRWRDPGADWRIRAEDELIYSTEHWAPLPAALVAFTSSGQPSGQTPSQTPSEAAGPSSSASAPAPAPSAPAASAPPASQPPQHAEAERPSGSSPENPFFGPSHPVAPAGTSEGHPSGSSGSG